MRSKEIIKLQLFIARVFGIPIDYKCIPGYFNGELLYQRIIDTFPNNSKFVEVGCFFGRSTCFMAQLLKKKGKQVTFDVIDTFEGSPEHQSFLQGKSFYEKFLENMRLAGVVTMLNVKKARSDQAAKNYANNSLDFVYLDAAHDYESVKQDIDAWLPKVKLNGIFAGDDYHESWAGVIAAVNEKLGKNSIEIIPKAQWLYIKK
jgi:predicted O-methyltransferase YrrM